MIDLDPSSATFHLDLRDVRRSLGFTKGQFAKKIGVSAMTLQHYETSPEKKHAKRPSDEILDRIIEYVESVDGNANALSGDVEEEWAW